MRRLKPIINGASGLPGLPAAKKFAVPASLNSTVAVAKPSTATSPKQSLSVARKPLASSSPSKPIASSSGASEEEEMSEELYFEILWTTRSSKMHKTYDNGTMKVIGSRCYIYDASGAAIGTSSSYSSSKLKELKEDDDLRVGDKELKVGPRISGAAGQEQLSSAKKVAQEPVGAPKVISKIVPNSSRGRLQLSSNAPLRVPRATAKPFESNDGNRFLLYSGGDNAETRTTEVILEGFLRDSMRPHQLTGVRFLFECVMGLRSHKYGPTTGCILADSMGLGKTLQTIALLRTLSTQSLRGFVVKKALVVVPASLVAPWAKEITKWLGLERMAPCVISELTKNAAKDSLKRFTDSVDQKLLIVSYEQVRIHIDILKNIAFGILICDEGHRLKNPNSKISQDLLSLNITRRVILTGTPFQNNMAEYFALVDFVNPGALGSSKEFKSVEKIISAARIRGASEAIREQACQLQQELLESTSPFILRRTSDVLEAFLPQKHELVVFCAPTKVQIQCYRNVLESFGIMSLKNEDTDDSSEMAEEAIEVSGLLDDSDIDSMSGSSALAAMTQLSKVCNHPSLLLPKNAEAEMTPFQVSIANSLLPADFDESQGPVAIRNACENSNHSGKLLVLDQLLSATKAATKDKFVVVSSFTKTLDLIGNMAAQKGWKFVRLDGSTDISHRNHAVEQFQRDPSVFLFLLSTKAGGVGLNLFAANRLVLFDSCWNPAFDTQAQARVWRDGQTKPTWIYRFLTTGMLDEKIFQRQLVKNEIGRTVLEDAADIDGGDPSETSSKGSVSKKEVKKDSTGLGVSSFSMEDLKDIFSINVQTLCDTHEISGCKCTSSTKSKKHVGSTKTKKITQQEISAYSHCSASSSFPDPILAKASSDRITFMFAKSTHPVQKDE